MGNRKSEDERIERVIRGLLKLPENRRCINCNLLGPQYVCTTFSTFVCTNCSGIHREFTHRVKSVSMAKFTPEEVTALQAGGNERAKQIHFKEWDPLRHSYPDSCNIQRLRDFIKHVYVERRFTGESCSGSLPRIRLDEKEESYASKKSSSFRFDFKSPHSSPGPRSDDTSFRYLYDESRSPRYTQKYSRHGHKARSPIKFEVVDDRFRDDEHRNRRLSNIESKLRQISFDGQKNVDRSQLPAVPPLGEILKENAPSQQVKPSGGEGSVEENPSEQKNNNPESSIDLSTKSQATHAAAGVGPEIPRITQSNESNWAIFEASTEKNDPKTPNTNTLKPSTTEVASGAATSAKNPLDLLLFELSGPVTPATGGMSQVPNGANNDPTITKVENSSAWDFPPISIGQTTASSNNSNVWTFTSTPATELAQPSNEVPPHTEVSHAHKPSTMQYLPSVSASCSSTTQPTNSPVKDVAPNNQPSVAPSTNDSSCAFTKLSSQITSKPTQETRPDVGSQPGKVETRSSERKELPEDLFTSSYSSCPAPLAGWQNVQPHGMGYGMQYYHNAMPPSALPIAPMSVNPFDVTDGRSLIHTSSLPTMASLQDVPPAASPRAGLMHASSLGSLGTTVSQSPCYSSPVPMGVYFDQANNNEQPTRPQRADSFNSEITAFGSIDRIQQSKRGYMQTPKTPNSSSNTRGNPFEFD
ncbi:ADP-ribosylation factor GTPase-activating protein AGD14 [Spatholobus suberectus]|nr:ADP-ribosylation factor GTPase-activating protein AGD14 [Spatholobus suberectus]